LHQVRAASISKFYSFSDPEGASLMVFPCGINAARADPPAKSDNAVMFNEQIQMRELLTRTICAKSPLIQTFLGNFYVDTHRSAHDSKLIPLSVRKRKKSITLH
jgi:hypothetical protein